MTMNVYGYAAMSPTEPLAPFRFERREPRADDVVIDILYCGVCHSDIHSARGHWAGGTYPMVPGHEIVGRVVSVGAKVVRFAPGDRVGVGCLVDSCRQCPACGREEQNYCPEMVLTYDDVDRIDHRPTYGGYSERIVVGDKLVLKLPDGLALQAAAPLLCAGITTWSPLQHWKVGNGTKLGVIGLGGLGHMALRFGKALGAEVTLFTRSPGKASEARRRGADHVVLSTDARQMDAVSGRFELIIDTAAYGHDLNPYIRTLAVNGTLVVVGHLGALEPAILSSPLVLGRRAVAGSVIGGIAETQQMLDFCGQHEIAADVELIAMAEINQAYERMIGGDVAHRLVIDLATLRV